MFKKIILSAAAILLLTPLAVARHRDHDDDDYRYVRGPSVIELSEELKRATRHVYREAEHRTHPYNRRGRQAVSALYQLKESARQFNRTVQRHRYVDRRVERQFNRLRATYDEAAYHMAHARSRHIREDFRRVSRLINRLDRGIDLASDRRRYRDYGDVRADHHHRHGTIVFGRDNGRTRYRVRVGW